MGVVLLNRMVRAGLIEKMTSEQRLEGMKELVIQLVWEKNVPGRGKSQHRGPKAGEYLVYWEQQGRQCGRNRVRMEVQDL